MPTFFQKAYYLLRKSILPFKEKHTTFVLLLKSPFFICNSSCYFLFPQNLVTLAEKFEVCRAGNTDVPLI